jgi:hypothetical protein
LLLKPRVEGDGGFQVGDRWASKAANWSEGPICRTCLAKATGIRGRCPGCAIDRLLPGRTQDGKQLPGLRWNHPQLLLRPLWFRGAAAYRSSSVSANLVGRSGSLRAVSLNLARVSCSLGGFVRLWTCGSSAQRRRRAAGCLTEVGLCSMDRTGFGETEAGCEENGQFH